MFENNGAIFKRVDEKWWQPFHVEYKEQLTELMKVSTELNQAVAAISAQRAEEQNKYDKALDSINKGERYRQSILGRLDQKNGKLKVFLIILRCALYLASLMCRIR